VAEKQRRGFYRWLQERIDLPVVLGWFFSATGLLYGGLDQRLELREGLQKALRKPVPKHVNFWFCFGGMTFLMFGVQVLTGVLLTLYYRPTPEGAYDSVRFISNHVTMGWLVRGLHHWCANLMILFVFVHMLRVFAYGAYKQPRELNWVAGCLLLFLTLGLGFTGYLLPWDQLSFWATKVGTEIAGAVPLVGHFVLYVLRGGNEISGATLTRFYAAHVIILPALTVFLLAAHFLMIRRQGISGPL